MLLVLYEPKSCRHGCRILVLRTYSITSCSWNWKTCQLFDTKTLWVDLPQGSADGRLSRATLTEFIHIYWALASAALGPNLHTKKVEFRSDKRAAHPSRPKCWPGGMCSPYLEMLIWWQLHHMRDRKTTLWHSQNQILVWIYMFYQQFISGCNLNVILSAVWWNLELTESHLMTYSTDFSALWPVVSSYIKSSL